MADFDPGLLKPWLEAHEKFAASIPAADPRFDRARQMLGIIAMARESLHPSADSTANFVHHREVIEQLATLRLEADNLLKRRDPHDR